MNEDEKWEFILSLDEEFLKGAVTISEWSTFLIKDADLAFVHGAHLASIITALAGIESHLKYEGDGRNGRKLLDLIDSAGLQEDLKKELHILRKYRNKWVHIRDAQDDQALLDHPECQEAELEEMAKKAIRALRRVIYSWQWV